MKWNERRFWEYFNKFMKNVFLSFVLISFILWILPLGYFIKPSQQQLACDGQRAMCMCHVMLPKSVDKVMPGVSLKAGATQGKENSSGGTGNYFVNSKPNIVITLNLSSIFDLQFLSYKNPFPVSIECVPKI